MQERDRDRVKQKEEKVPSAREVNKRVSAPSAEEYVLNSTWCMCVSVAVSTQPNRITFYLCACVAVWPGIGTYAKASKWCIASFDGEHK